MAGAGDPVVRVADQQVSDFLYEYPYRHSRYFFNMEGRVIQRQGLKQPAIETDRNQLLIYV